MIKDVQPQPEIVAGDQGICEVATHPDAEAVITGIVGCAGEADCGLDSLLSGSATQAPRPAVVAAPS